MYASCFKGMKRYCRRAEIFMVSWIIVRFTFNVYKMFKIIHKLVRYLNSFALYAKENMVE